jgi:hypothetical protein
MASAGHADPMIAGIAVERLLEHCQAYGLVLMKDCRAPILTDRYLPSEAR